MLRRINTEALREKRAAEREANLRALATVPAHRLHQGSYEGATTGEAVEKDNTIQCEEYRRLVAALPCKHCGIWGYSQAAHPNTGKAVGKKLIDDRECFPLCTVHPSPGGGGYVRGCHERFGPGRAVPQRGPPAN
jgi:hypothetical protein